jgi:tRNA threonylcarbamoyladenosine biosynthesis protein TsaB
MIEKVLAGAKVEREQIEVMAVGLGPGSYTGVRVAISLAQGWQLARGVKLLGMAARMSGGAGAGGKNIWPGKRGDRCAAE